MSCNSLNSLSEPLSHRSAEESSDEEYLLTSSDESSSYEDLTSSYSSESCSEEPDTDEEANKLAAEIEAAIAAQLDEVDNSVNEVNAILGAMPLPSAGIPIGESANPVSKLLTVQPLYLTVETEIMKKLTGAYIEEFRHRKAYIVHTPDHLNFPQVGLSMSMVGREGGNSYFTFDHNSEYQAMHQRFLNILNPQEKVPLDESQRKIHIEGLIEGSDFVLRAEEYRAALSIYQQIFVFLQKILHPSFDFADQTIRLEYKYLENRPFHVVLFKYMYLLSGKGYNRTALEVAKLLMNLDPADPLGIQYIIDTFAIKSKEYRWLVTFVDDWSMNDNPYLFNLKFSNALAHFIMTHRSKSNDYSLPNVLLRLTMAYYPTVTIELLKALSVTLGSEQQNHGLFTSDFQKTYITDPFLEIAITTYAKMVAPQWRDPSVMAWLLLNVEAVSARYDKEAVFKTRVNKIAAATIKDFSKPCPEGIRRSLLLLKPMSKLVVKYDMPPMVHNRPWDPLPPSNTVNRYNYALTDIDPRYYTALFSLLLAHDPSCIPPDLRGPEFAGMSWHLSNNSAYRRFATQMIIPEYGANAANVVAVIRQMNVEINPEVKDVDFRTEKDRD